MSFQDIMNKIRHWDNICARWMMRHFYIIFFEFVLVIIFFVFFFNTLHSIDLSAHTSSDNVVEEILMQQVTNTHIIIVLLLLNSFWTLFMFNGLNRIRLLLKDISYGLTKRRPAAKP